MNRDSRWPNSAPFPYLYKIFQFTEQNVYVQVTYRNPVLCTYILHKRHGQFFGAHSRILFLTSAEDSMDGRVSVAFVRKEPMITSSYGSQYKVPSSALISCGF